MLTGVISLDDGTFLAAGMRAAYTEDGTGVTCPAIALLRMEENGDTIYLRNLPLYAHQSTIRICRLSTGAVYVAGVHILPAGGGEYMVLGKVNPYDGSVYWFHNLPGAGSFGNAPNTNCLTEGPNHTLLIAGDFVEAGSSATAIGFVACYDTNGTQIWARDIHEHPTFTLCNYVEQTSHGTVIVSGTAGSRIWAAELTADSGREIRRSTFYQTQGLSYLDYQLAWVAQAPNGRFLVGGTTNQYRGYLGLHQGWAGSKIWGGESGRTINIRRVNDDGSMVFLNETGSTSHLNRIRADSSVIWSIPNPMPIGSEGTKFYSYAPLSDSSAIGVGVVAYNDSTNWDWFVGRITNMGIPYNPALVTSTTKPGPATPHPYPNPCRQSLGFAGLQGKARVVIHDAQGRPCLQQDLPPGRMLNVSPLAPGLYQYGLESAGRPYRGRIVKE